MAFFLGEWRWYLKEKFLSRNELCHQLTQKAQKSTLPGWTLGEIEILDSWHSLKNVTLCKSVFKDHHFRHTGGRWCDGLHCEIFSHKVSVPAVCDGELVV